MTFDQLLAKYPALGTQDGLIALLSEYYGKDNTKCICYPELKDLSFRLALAGCSKTQIQAITTFVKSPARWKPKNIEGQRYQTFGQFLIEKELARHQLNDRIEAMVHKYQQNAEISGLKAEYLRIREKDVQYLALSSLSLLEVDKLRLKLQVPEVVGMFLEVSHGYRLTKQVWEPHEDLEDCTAASIVNASQLSCYAGLATASYQWEGSIGHPTWKPEPDYIELFLSFGFDEESDCMYFKAVNPEIERGEHDE